MSDQNHFNEERIVSAVLSFINAKTWAESKAIVQAHNDLLTPEVFQVFESLLIQHKDDEEAISLLEDHHSLLLRCQREGIDAAFADRLQAQSMPDIPPELLAQLRSIHSEAELDKLIEEHPELLPVIQQMLNQSQASQESSTDVSSPGDLPALIQELQGLNRLSDMPRRVEVCQKALRLVDRNDQPELWSGLQNELGNSLAQNPLGSRAENIDLAIDHYNQALQVCTREAFPEQWAMTQNNLANAYSDRIRGERAENIDLAIDHYNQALQVRTLERFPADRRQTLRNLGHLCFTKQSWKNALAGYDGAIEAGNAVLAEAHTEVGRKSEVGETSRLYARSSYCLLKLEQTDKAILRLEEGKTRLLTEALALDNADLDMLSVKQKQAISEAREAVRLLEAEMRLPSDVPARRSDIELGKLLRDKRLDLNGLVDTLRSEHPDFMPKGLDLSGILELIPDGGALVAPLVTSNGSAVIVIPHGADRIGTDNVVMLDSLTEDDLLSLLRRSVEDTGPGGWMGTYFTFCNEKTKVAMEQWLEVIGKSTSHLWTMLMAPVHKKLQELNLAEGAPVTLMSQGYLGLLPLHAAWRDVDGKRRAFIDDYTVNYAPSAYSLNISKGRLQDTSRKKPSLLAVVNPTEDLRYTPVEGMAVTSLFDPDDRETLPENAATKQAVVEKVPGWTYLHFSCHGFYNWQDVMNSGLKMANHDILTLSDIISGLNLDTARLVTLSACETGMTDIRHHLMNLLGFLPVFSRQAQLAW